MVCAVLAVVLSLSALPLSAFAFESSEPQSKKQTNQYDDGATLLSAKDNPFISSAITAGELIYRLPDKEPDLNSIVISRADGSQSILYYTNPVKYVDENGKIKDKLLTIESLDERGFKTEQSDVVTTFGKTVSEGVSVKSGNVAIRLTPLQKSSDEVSQLNKVSGKSVQNGVLSTDRKTVTYKVDSKTDYIYSLTAMGFKEDITISSYTG